jgi:hypothetical protein
MNMAVCCEVHGGEIIRFYHGILVNGGGSTLMETVLRAT